MDHKHDWKKSFTGEEKGKTYQYYYCGCGELKREEEDVVREIDTSRARRNKDFFGGLRVSKK